MGPFAAFLQAGGVFMSAYSSREAGRRQAAQARENAERARMVAADALQRGEQRAARVELAYSRRRHQQIAAFARGGVDVSSGSAARVIAGTEAVGALDAEIQRNNAFRQAWGYELQAAYLERAAERTEDAAMFNLWGAVWGNAPMASGLDVSGSGGESGTAGWSDTMPAGGTDYYGSQGYM